MCNHEIPFYTDHIRLFLTTNEDLERTTNIVRTTATVYYPLRNSFFSYLTDSDLTRVSGLSYQDTLHVRAFLSVPLWTTTLRFSTVTTGSRISLVQEVLEQDLSDKPGTTLHSRESPPWFSEVPNRVVKPPWWRWVSNSTSIFVPTSNTRKEVLELFYGLSPCSLLLQWSTDYCPFSEQKR